MVNRGGYPGGFIGGSFGDVHGLNNLGQIVASSTYPGDEIMRMLLWTGGAGPFVFGGPGGTDTRLGINDVGEIAGSNRPEIPGPQVAAVWMIRLTRAERIESLRALVHGLVLRGALKRHDAAVLIKKLDKDRESLKPFGSHVRALLRSSRLARRDGRLLQRAIDLAAQTVH
jgi:hypothetical protein